MNINFFLSLILDVFGIKIKEKNFKIEVYLNNTVITRNINITMLKPHNVKFQTKLWKIPTPNLFTDYIISGLIFTAWP